MNVEGRFVLHPEVVIRENRAAADGEYVVLKRGSRIGGRGIEATFFRLLTQFREPTPILDAVIHHAEEENGDPEAILEEAWASLWRLIGSGVLVDGDVNWEPLKQKLRVGDLILEARVVECVRLMDDYQVYRGVLPDGRPVAVKMSHPDQKGAVNLLRREGKLLEELGGVVTPALIGVAEEPWPTLISAWCPGVPLALWLHGPRTDRLAVASRIAHAYRELHLRGVLHVDVNLNNIVVGPDSVALIDLAGSVRLDERPIPRLGVLGFQEPEYLVAVDAKNPPPHASVAGEQYSVGCVLYHVICGVGPIRVDDDREVAAKDLVERPPRPFADQGIFNLKRVEGVVLRALSKAPESRFSSVAELAERLDVAIAAFQPKARVQGGVAAELIRVLSAGGEWHGERYPGQPRCSINSGTGGVALALLELAIQRDDSSLLRLATDWFARTRLWSRHPNAFKAEEYPRISQIVDDGVSILHTDLGSAWLQVLVLESTEREAARNKAVEKLLARATHPFTNYDLALGRAGNLAAAASILGRTGAERVRSLGDRVSQELADFSTRFGPIARTDGSGMNLGMAHGWAGLLWAAALWSRATKEPMPIWSLERAEQLIEQAVADKSGGLSWAWWMGEKDGFAPGWCNGTAGFVLTFCEIAAATGDDRWAKLAERAGARLLSIRWGTGHLCCGAAGGVYAAARLHQVTGEARWMRALVRARDGALANAGRHESAASLYKGDVGLLALDDDPSVLAKLVFPGFW